MKFGLKGRLFLFSLLLAAAFFLPAELPVELVLTYEEESLSVFSLTPPLLQLPKVQVELLFSEKRELQQEALAITAREVANYLKLGGEAGDWQALAVELPLASGKPKGSGHGEGAANTDPITEHTGTKGVALALSRLPEEGLVCLLIPGSRGYTLVYAQEGFLPITGLSLWPLPKDNADAAVKTNIQTFTEKAAASSSFPGAGEASSLSLPWLLAITETHDESLGAYSRVRRFSLWGWSISDEKLEQAFTANLSWQLAFPQNQSWIGAAQELQIEGAGKELLLSCKQSYCQSQEFRSSLLSPANWEAEGFASLESQNRSYREQYRYDFQYGAFGLGRGLWQPAGQDPSLPVLILRDLSLDLEGPFAPREEYQLKTQEGLLTAAPKTEVTLLEPHQ